MLDALEYTLHYKTDDRALAGKASSQWGIKRERGEGSNKAEARPMRLKLRDIIKGPA